MGLLQLRSSLRNPERWLKDFFLGGSATEAGTSINEENSMAISAVFSCVTLISETVASLPLILYKRRKGGGKDRATAHPLYTILHDAPNDEMTAFNFREAQTAHRLLWGNSYSPIERIRMTGSTKALWLIEPDKADIKRDRKTKRIYYEVNEPDGTTKRYEADQILHVPSFSKNGIVGQSVVGFQREKLGIASALDRFEARFFGKGTNPGAIVTLPIEARGMKDDAANIYLKSLTKQWSGIGNSHGIMLLRNGEKFERAAMPLQDAQFLELYKAKAVDVCGWFKVPPHMIAILDKATFSNIEHQAIQFVTNCIRPWLVREEQVINARLLSDKERKQGYFVENLIDALLRGDVQARSEFYRAMFNIGAMSQNDIREKENMNPIENGDKYYVPLNMVPADEPYQADDGDTQPDQDNVRHIEHRSRQAQAIKLIQTEKKKARTAILPIAKRIVSSEISELKAIFEGRKLRLSPGELSARLETFYIDQRQTISTRLKPLVDNTVRSIIEQSGVVLGAEIEITATIERFINDYAEKYAFRHCGSSLGQLVKIAEDLKADEPAMLAALLTRLDEWGEKRAQKIALNESVRLVGAASREGWKSGGVTKLRWVTQGKNCPFCDHMDGKIVGIDEPFLRDGDVLYVGPDKGHIYNPDDPMSKTPIEGPGTGSGWMALKSYGAKHHPPIHAGCDCAILPEVS